MLGLALDKTARRYPVLRKAVIGSATATRSWAPSGKFFLKPELSSHDNFMYQWPPVKKKGGKKVPPARERVLTIFCHLL